MKTRSLFPVLAIPLLLITAACGGDSPAEAERAMPAGIAIQEGERPFGGFAISSGQPTEARLKEVAPHMALVVNFRMKEEHPFDEEKVVKDAGGTYIHWGSDKERLQSTMKRVAAYAIIEKALAEKQKMSFFHCGSGNRVGALWALFKAEHQKVPLEEAIAAGKDAGLTSLEPLVREIVAKSELLAK